MSHELFFTSLPRGLRPNSTGYSVVSTTQNLPIALGDYLEKLSSYDPVYDFHDRRAQSNPVGFAHYKLQTGGRTWHILSRVCDAGADYSGRSNFFAHHIACNAAESEPALAGPAALQRLPEFMKTHWMGEARYWTEPRSFAQADVRPERWGAWAGAVGNESSGWAGVLAQTAFERSASVITILYDLAMPRKPLELIDEALWLLPPEMRWNVTYSTHATQVLPSFECKWRFLPHEHPQAKAALAGGGLVLNLGQLPSLDRPPHAWATIVENARQRGLIAAALRGETWSEPTVTASSETAADLEPGREAGTGDSTALPASSAHGENTRTTANPNPVVLNSVDGSTSLDLVLSGGTGAASAWYLRQSVWIGAGIAAIVGLVVTFGLPYWNDLQQQQAIAMRREAIVAAIKDLNYPEAEQLLEELASLYPVAAPEISKPLRKRIESGKQELAKDAHKESLRARQFDEALAAVAKSAAIADLKAVKTARDQLAGPRALAITESEKQRLSKLASTIDADIARLEQAEKNQLAANEAAKQALVATKPVEPQVAAAVAAPKMDAPTKEVQPVRDPFEELKKQLTPETWYFDLGKLPGSDSLIDAAKPITLTTLLIADAALLDVALDAKRPRKANVELTVAKTSANVWQVKKKGGQVEGAELGRFTFKPNGELDFQWTDRDPDQQWLTKCQLQLAVGDKKFDPIPLAKPVPPTEFSVGPKKLSGSIELSEELKASQTIQVSTIALAQLYQTDGPLSLKLARIKTLINGQPIYLLPGESGKAILRLGPSELPAELPKHVSGYRSDRDLRYPDIELELKFDPPYLKWNCYFPVRILNGSDDISSPPVALTPKGLGIQAASSQKALVEILSAATKKNSEFDQCQKRLDLHKENNAKLRAAGMQPAPPLVEEEKRKAELSAELNALEIRRNFWTDVMDRYRLLNTWKESLNDSEAIRFRVTAKDE